MIFMSQCTWFDRCPAWGVVPDPLLVTVSPLSPVQTKEHLVSLYLDHLLSLLLDVYTPCLKPLYSKYIDLVYTVCTEITSDPRHLTYISSRHMAAFIVLLVHQW